MGLKVPPTPPSLQVPPVAPPQLNLPNRRKLRPWQIGLSAVPALTVDNRFTVKVPALVPVPPLVVTVTFPVVPAPITATMVVPLFETIELTGVPPIFTDKAKAVVKPVPFMVIFVPTHPIDDPKLVMVGTGKVLTSIPTVVVISVKPALRTLTQSTDVDVPACSLI